MPASVLDNNIKWLDLGLLPEFGKDHRMGELLISPEHRGYIASVFGTAREHAVTAEIARGLTIAVSLASQCREDIAILQGGGSGAMRIANEATPPEKAISVRSGILGNEHTEGIVGELATADNFLYTRRFILTTAPDIVISVPGGFGTLNEVFEVFMLNQRGLINTKSLILLDDSSGFWADFKKFTLEELARSSADHKLLDNLMQIVGVDAPNFEEQIRAILDSTTPNRDTLNHSSINRSWFSESVRSQVLLDFEGALDHFSQKPQGAIPSTTLATVFGTYADQMKTEIQDKTVIATNRKTMEQMGQSVPLIPVFSKVTEPELPPLLSSQAIPAFGIEKLLCVPRFIQTTASDVQLFGEMNLDSIVAFTESIMLRQLKITSGSPLVCFEQKEGWSKFKAFLSTQVVRGRYINTADLDLFEVRKER